MPLVLGGSSAAAAAFSVDNSCRFNPGDSPGLVQTPTAGDPDKWTFSCWFKRNNTSSGTYLLTCVDGSNDVSIGFNSGAALFWTEYPGSTVGKLQTNRVFRDQSAWMHMVFTWDSANVSAGDRMRLYINGTEETSFSTDTQPSSGQDSVLGTAYPVAIGSYNVASNYNGCYFAEVAYCNGQAYGPTDFGEFDSDSPTIWKPIDVSGLTFGTGGFYLDFEDSANLGADVSGQGNDFTESNLTAADQATDTPTNNFCTINPLDNFYQAAAFKEGNNYLTASGTGNPFNTCTMGMASGKWYWEAELVNNGGLGDYQLFGIAGDACTATLNWLGKNLYGWGLYNNAGSAAVLKNNDGNVGSWTGVTYTDADILGCALDLDNNKLYFHKNGTYMNSGVPTSGATGTGAASITAAASTTFGFYLPALGQLSAVVTQWAANFGGCPAFTVSSGNADENGYGNFEYAPPSGYLALCTKNLGSDGG